MRRKTSTKNKVSITVQWPAQAHRALVDLVAVNAATLIFLGTSQHTLPEAFALAREVLASGAALARLRDLARLSGGTDEAIRR
jgi:anthranilate phosphoribosyltransferase